MRHIKSEYKIEINYFFRFCSSEIWINFPKLYIQISPTYVELTFPKNFCASQSYINYYGKVKTLYAI